jgi:hypothetical protein
LSAEITGCPVGGQSCGRAVAFDFVFRIRADEGPCSARQSHVNPDSTFGVEGLIGTCTAPLQPMFGRWMLKSVTVNGEDVLTRAIAFEPGQQFRDVQVVFTDRRSSMTFRVTDDAGQPTRDYVVLVFFTDQARWQKTPYVRTYVPPQVLDALSAEPRAASLVPPAMPPRRAETIEALAPGEYYVVAVEDVDVEAIRSVELLERLIPSAARVSVAEGAHLDVPSLAPACKAWPRNAKIEI